MNPLTIYKSRLYRTPALLAVAAVAAILFNSTVASAIEDYGRLNHAGRWITDSKGRVIIIHGVNMPSKLPPAYPSAIGFKDDDGKFLEQLGFNGVRLTVERYAVEPTPGHFDPRYVEHMAGTIRMLARHGILSLVDFHQDEYGPVFHDNGYPDWMTVTDGLTNNWEVLFPFQYLENPANMRAFDNLWTNDTGPDGKPLQQDDAEILAYVVRRLRDEPGILGYEILNEPWPGSQWEDCALSVTGCPDLDQSYLGAYYAQVIPAVRGADPKHMIWFEPFSTFNYGVPTSVAPPSDPNLGFSFHDYSLCAALGVPSCDPVAEAEAVLSNAIAYSASTGDALLETEFGGGTD
ncbi:MAG TPA: cellulase family glycosylhydrolase, partial [Candidatus Binataceae bacterium]|nr:cellulase family glycosylhydrolase [Candidatus Binataceae bacterium]